MSAGLFQVIVGVTLMYVKPLVKVAGLPVLSVTVIFTRPATCAGVVAVRCVLSTRVPATVVVPNVTVKGACPGANPLPVIVTVVPPVIGPEFGLMLVSPIASLNAV